MKARLSLVTILLLAAPLAAQHHPKHQPQAGQQDSQSTQKGETRRERLRASEPQREQYRVCSQEVQYVRAQARELRRLSQARGGVVDAERARQVRDQMREHIAIMQREHNQFVQGMSEEQREALQAQVRNLQHAGDRVHMQMQGLNDELARHDPDPEHVADYARALEKAVNEWHRHHRSMAAPMDIKP